MNNPGDLPRLTDQIQKMLTAIETTTDPHRKNKLNQKLVRTVDALEESSKTYLQNTIKDLSATYTTLKAGFSELDKSINRFLQSEHFGEAPAEDEIKNFMDEIANKPQQKTKRKAPNSIRASNLGDRPAKSKTTLSADEELSARFATLFPAPPSEEELNARLAKLSPTPPSEEELKARFAKLKKDTAHITAFVANQKPSPVSTSHNASDPNASSWPMEPTNAIELPGEEEELKANREDAVLNQIKPLKNAEDITEKANQILKAAKDLKQDLHTAHNNAEAERKYILATKYSGNPAKARQATNNPSQEKFKAATSTMSFTAKVLKELNELVTTVKNLFNAWFTPKAAAVVKTHQPTSSPKTSATKQDALDKHYTTIARLEKKLSSDQSKRRKLLTELTAIKQSTPQNRHKLKFQYVRKLGREIRQNLMIINNLKTTTGYLLDAKPSTNSKKDISPPARRSLKRN